MLRRLRHAVDVAQGKAPVGAHRSPAWRRVRAAHLGAFPRCALCGGKDKLEVHHKVPFHVDPARELDPTNLITLCENKRRGVNCHLLFGHLGNYRWYNADVDFDVTSWRERLATMGRQLNQSTLVGSTERRKWPWL